jgi:hypothetical protein
MAPQPASQPATPLTHSKTLPATAQQPHSLPFLPAAALTHAGAACASPWPGRVGRWPLAPVALQRACVSYVLLSPARGASALTGEEEGQAQGAAYYTVAGEGAQEDGGSDSWHSISSDTPGQPQLPSFPSQPARPAASPPPPPAPRQRHLPPPLLRSPPPAPSARAPRATAAAAAAKPPPQPPPAPPPASPPPKAAAVVILRAATTKAPRPPPPSPAEEPPTQGPPFDAPPDAEEAPPSTPAPPPAFRKQPPKSKLPPPAPRLPPPKAARWGAGTAPEQPSVVCRG